MAENHPIKPEEKQNAPIQKNEKPTTDENNIADKPNSELEKNITSFTAETMKLNPDAVPYRVREKNFLKLKYPNNQQVIPSKF